MFQTYVALGDSFTEGLDDLGPNGNYRGWADIVAERLSREQPGFRYANLAVRGRRLAPITVEQLPLVEQVRPDLVTIAAGGNDILGFRCDIPALASAMHEVLERLTRSAGRVLVFTGFNPRHRLPLGRALAARAGAYNALLAKAAAELGVTVVYLWHMEALYEDSTWAPDRLHLNSVGHRLVAAAVLEALGVQPDPFVAAQATTTARRLPVGRDDVVWARAHLAPWLVRRLRRRSTGDGVQAKVPVLTAWPPPP